MEYTAARAAVMPRLEDGWDEGAWAQTQPLTIEHYHPRSSDHRPAVQAKLLYTDDALWLRFRVPDRYIFAKRTRYLESVCCDACVEFFVSPKPEIGYLNFEMNCIGTLLLGFCPPDRDVAGRDDVPWELGQTVEIRTDFPAEPIVPQIDDAREWNLAMCIPLAVLEHYMGSLAPLSGQRWTANFYKCASDCSHPHWGSWSPVGEQLNFHQPDRFGTLIFQ